MSVAGFAIPNPRFYAFSQTTNLPLVGGMVQFYLTGTTNPQPVYADIGCTIPLANPVILDANGSAEIYGNAIYDIKVYDSNSVLQYTMLGVSFSPAAGSSGTTTPEWLIQSGTLTYLSTTSFAIAGNQTAIFTPGRRIQVIVTAGTLYGTIISSTFGTSTTVVVSLDSGNLDSGLSQVAVGIINAQNTSLPTLTPLSTMIGGTTAYTLNIQRGDLLKGTRIQAIVNATNTGASTLAINGGTAKNITKQGSTALVSGDMQINMIADLEYDGTEWILLNPYTIASAQLPSGTISGNSLSGLGSNNVVGITNQAASSANINLPAGNWMIMAWGEINLDNFTGTYTLTLTINGTTVFSWVAPTLNPASSFAVPLHGNLIVNGWGGGNLAIAIATTGTSSWNAPIISAVAIKLG
jgi:hypothetical protein